MKVKSVLFRDDVAMPGNASGMTGGLQDGRIKGLTIEADFTRRVVVLALDDEAVMVPFENVRHMRVVPSEGKPAAKGKGKAAETAS